MASAEIVITGDDKDALKAFERILKKQIQLGEKAEKAGKKSKEAFEKSQKAAEKTGGKIEKAGDEHEKSFGEKAEKQLISYASGFLSITAGINLALQAFKALEDEKKEAARKAKEVRFDLGSLVQVSGGDEAKYKRGKKGAEDLFKTGMFDGRSEAIQTIFQLQSANIKVTDDIIKKFADLKMIKADPIKISQSISALVKSLGGYEKAGGIDEIINKSLAAGAGSPDVASDLMTAAAKSGKAASLTGTNLSELLSATMVLANIEGSEQAGTSMQRLLVDMSKEDKIRGMNFVDAIQKLGKMATTEEGILKPSLVLPKEKSQLALVTLLKEQNMKALKGMIEDTKTAAKENRFGKMVKMAYGDPEIATPAMQVAAEAKGEISKISLGLIENIARSIQQKRRTSHREAGGGEFVGAFTENIKENLEIAWDPEEYIRDYGSAKQKESAARISGEAENDSTWFKTAKGFSELLSGKRGVFEPVPLSKSILNDIDENEGSN